MSDKTTKTRQKGRLRTSSRGLGKHVPDRKKVMDTFLESYSQTHNILVSCLAANVDRTTIWRWASEDQSFGTRYRDAEADYRDRLHSELHRRIFEGIEKPITVAGKREVIRELSDTLLIFEMKRHMPEYRDRWEGDAPMPPWAQSQATANAFVFVLNGEQKAAANMSEVELAAAEQALIEERAKLEAGGEVHNSVDEPVPE